MRDDWDRDLGNTITGIVIVFHPVWGPFKRVQRSLLPVDIVWAEIVS